MSKVKLLKHQVDVLQKTKLFNKVAYYLDMGLGKTYVSSEKALSYRNTRILVCCQKSKVDDWLNHFKNNYGVKTFNLRNNKEFHSFMNFLANEHAVGVVNYSKAIKLDFYALWDFTLIVDESSILANANNKFYKLVASLNYNNLILLSGTPIDGKYEQLYPQLKLLGYGKTKKYFYDNYICYTEKYIRGLPYPIKMIDGYKNVEQLKNSLKSSGAVFMKSEDVIDLPEQTINVVKVENNKSYKEMLKKRTTTVDNEFLIGDTASKLFVYLRYLASAYSKEKLQALKDLLESTNKRVVVFYSFNVELEKIESLCLELNRNVAIVNGSKNTLENFYKHDDCIALIQYQAGAKGLDLQQSNLMILFSLPLSYADFSQSLKRIHRIGQSKPCFYYILTTKNSVDEDIYSALENKHDYMLDLFNEHQQY